MTDSSLVSTTISVIKILGFINRFINFLANLKLPIYSYLISYPSCILLSHLPTKLLVYRIAALGQGTVGRPPRALDIKGRRGAGAPLPRRLLFTPQAHLYIRWRPLFSSRALLSPHAPPYLRRRPLIPARALLSPHAPSYPRTRPIIPARAPLSPYAPPYPRTPLLTVHLTCK